ncbi:MAG: hypothetical protein IPL60_03925 [Ardenticatenia bacterium]|nr:hypothetical protein [Ardenticatenia bacterium]
MPDALPSIAGSLCNDLRPTDKANANRFAAWSLFTAVVYVAGTYLLIKNLLGTGAPAVAFALACNLPALGAVSAYRRFLAEAEERVRQIHLEGLGYGMAAGVIFSMGWRLLELAGAPRLDVSDGVVVTMLAWALGQVLARRKYS